MDFDTKIPIYIQVMDHMKLDIVRGKIGLGDKLPSARELAVSHNINPNTANRIYREMEIEGICYTKRGIGTFVAEDEDIIINLRSEISDALLSEFITGMKDLKYTYEETIVILKEHYDSY